MSRIPLVRCAIALFGMLLCATSHAAADECVFQEQGLLSRPLADQGPTEIVTRIYVNDVVRIDDAQQSFTADVFFRAQWLDPRLVHSGREPCTVAITDIWNPDLQLLNRRSVEQVRQPDPYVQPDGLVVMAMRGFGEFSFRADLTEFPFDAQILPFNVVSVYGESDIRFAIEPDLLSLAPVLSVANWVISPGGARAEEQYVAAVDRHLLRLDVLLDAQRRTGFYTWQQMVPLLLVVMMTWVVFWIPLEFVAPRVGLAATAMLTLIAYRFAMSSVLPPIAYLTRLDLFMIGASVLVFGSLVVSVAVTWIEHNRSAALAQRVNLSACWLSPVLLVGLCLFALYS